MKIASQRQSHHAKERGTVGGEKEQAKPWRGQAWELPRRSRGRAKGIGSQGWAGWMTCDAAAGRERPGAPGLGGLPDVGKGG